MNEDRTQLSPASVPLNLPACPGGSDGLLGSLAQTKPFQGQSRSDIHKKKGQELASDARVFLLRLFEED